MTTTDTTDQITDDTADLPEPNPARKPANANLLALVRAATLLPPTPGRTLIAVAALYADADPAVDGDQPLIDEEAIANDVGVKAESVRGILHDLADLGWIERVPTLADGGRRSITRFRLHWQARRAD